MLPADYKGALELTWTNKDLRLLAQEDGAYEWMPSADYRVAEVRLLDNAGTVGEVAADESRATDNLVIRGDALNALTSLTQLPEFAEELVGKVKLAYIDPPFNTQQSFLHYDDSLEHSVWLTMMRDRLDQIRELLRPDGSVWVHLDDSEMAYCKVVLDELFGRRGFVGTIVWEKAQGTRGDTDLTAAHDYILVYARERELWKHTRNLLPRTTDQMARYQNPDNDPRGPWRQGADGRAKSGSDRNRFPVTLPSGRTIRPPAGTYWRFTPERLEEARAEGRVWFGKDGDGMPVIKTYLTEAQEGVVPRTWWPASEVGSNQEAKRDHLRRLFPDREPFATPKPERLLQRIIHIATDPGDIVLDCFLGSGTTAAVAQKLGRRWVGIERSADTLDNYTLPRLQRVVAGDDPWGITETVSWAGGGGFRILDVAPSMFATDRDVVLLAEWATNGRLSEAAAAQLGYVFERDAPFCGRKGRQRLAVVDGLVNESVARLLAGALGEGERLVLCGTAVDPIAGDVLRELSPGSSVRKIPSSILDRYRQASQWVPRTEPSDVEMPGVAELGTAPKLGRPGASAEPAAA
jgi:adenine-specific DNA-methyltransferase